MIDAALAEREALAEAWWKVHGTIDPPTALQINSLAALLAVCANEALERVAQLPKRWRELAGPPEHWRADMIAPGRATMHRCAEELERAMKAEG